MFETIKRLFKKEEPNVIEVFEEAVKKMKEHYAIAKEIQKKEKVMEARNETGKLIGFFGPDGFEKVDSTYEERGMLREVLERLDKIESALNIEKEEE